MVSTPEMDKGRKRKAQDDSGKGKRKKKKKKKKEESSSTLTFERNTFYFVEDTSQERYNLDFSLRKVLNGLWIDFDFFDVHNFEYSVKMDKLGWTPMITLRDEVYPDLVAYFYANATKGYHCDMINSYVK